MTEFANIKIFKGNITTLPVDAIVNAANSSLAGGGGVDGAIHAAAGPELKRASVQLAPCPPGQARITPGFNLPAKYVIHTVGPIWRGGDQGEPELLASAYRSSFELALEHDCTTIALPAVSCGAYGYPIDEAVAIALSTAQDFGTHFEEISFPCYDGRVLRAFEQVAQQEGHNT